MSKLSRGTGSRATVAGIVMAVVAALVSGPVGTAMAADTYALMVSASPDRSEAVPLDGTTQAASIHVFTTPTTGVARVRFYLDDPAMSGAPRQIEKGAPHDFAGTAKDGTALPFDTRKVAAGAHEVTAAVDLTTGGTVVLSGRFTVEHTGPGPEPALYDLMVSDSPTRAAPAALEGQQVSDSVYVFTSPDENVRRVRFFLDDPLMSGTASRVEGNAPYDFGGTAADGTALPFDTTKVPDGEHVITAEVEHPDGAKTVVSSTFTIQQGPASPDLTVDSSTVSLQGTEGGDSARAAVTLGTSDGASVPYASVSSADWLSVEPGNGTAPGNVEIVATPGVLATGTYSGSVTFTAEGYDPVAVTVTYVVRSTAGGAYDIVMSTRSDRTSPQLLEGRTVSGSVYVFLAPDSGVSSTSWWLDDMERAGSPWRVDNAAPYDFMPNSKPSAAVPFKTNTVPDGDHTITVVVTATSGDVHVVNASFTTDNGTNALTWTPESMTVDVDPGSTDPVTLVAEVTATKPGTVATLSGGDPLITFLDGVSVTTPATVRMSVDPSTLSRGSYELSVHAAADGAFPDILPVRINFGDSQGCEPIACDLIRITPPYIMPFDGNQNLIIDRFGVGTGFSMLLPHDGGKYVRKAIELDAGASVLKITAAAGSFKGAENGQENALGVGFNGGAYNVVATTLTNIPTLSGKYEQAGLWFGYDQDNVLKLDLVSTPNGPRVEQVLEVAGGQTAAKQGALLALGPGDQVGLRVKGDPTARTLTGEYRVNSGAWIKIGSFDTAGEFFSADAAGIDPLIGTRTFAGVYTTKRKASGTPVFEFADFSVTGEAVSTAGDLEFSRTSHEVPYPTSMAFGPDGRLYVVTLMGGIHVLTYDETTQDVVADQLVSTLGQRLALGIAIDPESTPENVIVWVAHSSPSLSSGAADSGVVTRLSGPSLGTRVDVITGLPRSIANHGPNSLHFGPDGRLFMAIGGNTGAGAPNEANTEFGDRGEQPLSAALLVADPKAAGFDGSCADPADMYSSDDCDVRVYSSGLRNTYDFVFHSNGNIYGPDNGLGVTGSYPPSPQPPCFGFGSTTSSKDGGHNPGEQPDELNLLVDGGYYGHPNPTRGECVFGDGSYQGVTPLPNYHPAAHDLGKSKSANGIIEYSGGAFCGSIRKNLLVTNYSVGDDIVALRISADGKSVVQSTSLVAGFTDPLPIVEGPDGSILVGEFGGGLVTRLTAKDTGCWTDAGTMPEALLDAGGAAIDGKVYVVGGKTPAGPQSKVFVYDVSADSWSNVPDLPGPGVENPATVAVGGKLYVFGGSTGPFSGAVANSGVFDPDTATWTALPAMPTARGGAVVQHVDGGLYVIGGMTGDGASSSVVERYDIASKSWSSAPAMTTARDNPGSAAIDGRIYVFGGRTRLASGTTVNGALATVEAFDPAAGTWAARSSMPTGRRTVVSAVVDGQAIVAGGEGGSDGNAFGATERYDPATDSWDRLWPMLTPRHGAAGGVVGDVLHVFGGGPKTGSAWTDKHEIFRPPA